MIAVTILDGLRHRIIGVEPDPRIVSTACELRVAMIERRPDRTSAYQRATRHDWTTAPCQSCLAGGAA